MNNYRTILLSNGKQAVVDDEDFEYLNQWKWTWDRGYAARRNYKEKKKIYLHRIIMNPLDNEEIDHINRNPLDNRKINLRISDSRLNKYNRGLNKNNTHGIKGVRYQPYSYKNGKQYLRKKPWVAQIYINYKNIFLGNFLTKEEAGQAYLEALNKQISLLV